MAMQHRIGLEGLEFFAYHGFYEAERSVGNRYLVNLEVGTVFTEAAVEDSLSQTINYEQIYALVQQEMLKPSHLLENVVHRLAEEIFTTYAEVSDIRVELKKFNPPLGGICKSAYVVLQETRDSFLR